MFKSGQPRPANSGRAKGTKNRIMRPNLLEVLNKRGCDPLDELITMARETEDDYLRKDIYQFLAKYEHPLPTKSLEINNNIQHQATLVVERATVNKLLNDPNTLEAINLIETKLAESEDNEDTNNED